MNKLLSTLRPCLLSALVILATTQPLAAEKPNANPEPKTKRLSFLFLGDHGHHRPTDRAKQLIPVMAERGIEITYTDKAEVLSTQMLAKFDGLILYANIQRITPAQEKALLDYVSGGGAFVPLHCASYCFLNSPKYIELVGAQFQRHGTGIFRTQIVGAKHPTMVNLPEFETWDETYVHTKHNTTNRTVLQVRKERGGEEPWTWVRTHGKGRVFYTAYGHDQRTFGHPGFHALVERGMRWAAGDDRVVENVTKKRTDVKPFEYSKAKLPNYLAGKRWGTQGDPIGQMQKPITPTESIKHMVTPREFHVELFAAEPNIAKPICMTWDHKGRLWIAETTDYPNNIQPQGKGHDRIKICEDTSGDGRADKFTVFAEGLSIPTSLTLYNGGVIVHQAPHTLFLKDTNGDDKADVRKTLFTGWSTGDTHAGPSNMHWGFDNWIWGMVGYSGFSGTVGDERHSFRTGFYRFKPDGSKMEFLRNTNNNSWGVSFSEEGFVFGSTANGNPSVYMPIANRYYESVRGWSSSVLGGIAESSNFYPVTDKVRQVDWHGKFTAAAGHAFYTARNFPQAYWNRAAFVNEPTGHLVATFLIEAKGADFVSRNRWNLFASHDEWTAPIMSEVGPDGAVWMIDWYNYIVQHNPTPRGFKTGKGNAYATGLRDKTHGRIYRIVYNRAKPSKIKSLDGASPEQLVAALSNDNLFWRKTAQRLLVERGSRDVAKPLIRLTADKSVDEIGLNGGAIHALWTLHGLGLLDGKHSGATAAAIAALIHPSAGVRRAATQTIPRSKASLTALLSAGVVADSDAQVRLAALLAISEMPASDDVGSVLVSVLAKPENANDRWLTDAVTSAAAAHDLVFLKAVAASKLKSNSATEQIIARVAEHYARGGPAKSAGTLIAALSASDSKLTNTIVAGLAAGWPKNTPAELDERSEKAMAGLLAKLSPATKGQFIKLATLWGSSSFEKYAGQIVKSMLATVNDESQSDASRLESARQLVEFRTQDTQVVRQLLAAVTPQSSPQLAGGILDLLSISEAANVGVTLTDRFSRFSPSARRVALRVLMRRASSTVALVEAMEKGQIQFSELSLDQKQSLSNHPDKKLAARAKKILAQGGGLPSADRQKVLEQLMPLTKVTGDPALGKIVFTKQCAKCHTHSGEGTRIGPDLTGMAVHPKAELLTHIIDPSRSVEGNFRVYSVLTVDGQTLTGLLASETKTTIELFDTEGKKHIVLREEIDQLIGSPKSLMPEGFEKQVKPKDITDLLEFLTQRGKYLPLPLDKVATVVSTRDMFFNSKSTTERLVFPDWKPKTFAGVPFVLVDPQGDRVANVVMLHGPNGVTPPKMPKQVSLACGSSARAIHFLSGVSGWGAKREKSGGTVSMIVRLQYEDGQTEDHRLIDGQHFADYIGYFNVPKSKLAFKLRGQQIRYLAVFPKRSEKIKTIQLVKGPDRTAPVVMAITIETPRPFQKK